MNSNKLQFLAFTLVSEFAILDDPLNLALIAIIGVLVLLVIVIAYVLFKSRPQAPKTQHAGGNAPGFEKSFSSLKQDFQSKKISEAEYKQRLTLLLNELKSLEEKKEKMPEPLQKPQMPNQQKPAIAVPQPKLTPEQPKPEIRLQPAVQAVPQEKSIAVQKAPEKIQEEKPDLNQIKKELPTKGTEIQQASSGNNSVIEMDDELSQWRKKAKEMKETGSNGKTEVLSRQGIIDFPDDMPKDAKKSAEKIAPKPSAMRDDELMQIPPLDVQPKEQVREIYKERKIESNVLPIEEKKPEIIAEKKGFLPPELIEEGSPAKKQELEKPLKIPAQQAQKAAAEKPIMPSKKPETKMQEPQSHHESVIERLMHTQEPSKPVLENAKDETNSSNVKKGALFSYEDIRIPSLKEMKPEKAAEEKENDAPKQPENYEYRVMPDEKKPSLPEDADDGTQYTDDELKDKIMREINQENEKKEKRKHSNFF